MVAGAVWAGLVGPADGTALGLGAGLVAPEVGCTELFTPGLALWLDVADVPGVAGVVGCTVPLLLVPPVTLPTVVPPDVWPHTLASIGLPVPNSISVITSIATRNTATDVTAVMTQRGWPRRPRTAPPSPPLCLPPPLVPLFRPEPSDPLRPSLPIRTVPNWAVSASASPTSARVRLPPGPQVWPLLLRAWP